MIKNTKVSYNYLVEGKVYIPDGSPEPLTEWNTLIIVNSKSVALEIAGMINKVFEQSDARLRLPPADMTIRDVRVREELREPIEPFKEDDGITFMPFYRNDL